MWASKSRTAEGFAPTEVGCRDRLVEVEKFEEIGRKERQDDAATRERGEVAVAMVPGGRSETSGVSGLGWWIRFVCANYATATGAKVALPRFTRPYTRSRPGCAPLLRRKPAIRSIAPALSGIKMAANLPNLRRLFVESRTEAEESAYSRNAFYNLALFMSSVMVFSIVAQRMTHGKAL